MSKLALCIDLGQAAYQEVLELQRILVRQRQNQEIPDCLILVEHPPTITFGRSARTTNLLASEDELNRLGVEMLHVERGGDVTFHGPGQLVGYPIFQLAEEFVGVRRFVNGLEGALVTALGRLRISAGTVPGAVGVWVGQRKIASIGIAVARRVVFHGFALNVTVDLSWFRLIKPCGFEAAVMTSIEREGGETDPGLVRSAVKQALTERFGLSFQSNLPRSLTCLTSGLIRSAIDSA